jgi:hypothetical protein
MDTTTTVQPLMQLLIRDLEEYRYEHPELVQFLEANARLNRYVNDDPNSYPMPWRTLMRHTKELPYIAERALLGTYN